MAARSPQTNRIYRACHILKWGRPPGGTGKFTAEAPRRRVLKALAELGGAACSRRSSAEGAEELLGSRPELQYGDSGLYGSSGKQHPGAAAWRFLGSFGARIPG